MLSHVCAVGTVPSAFSASSLDDSEFSAPLRPPRSSNGIYSAAIAIGRVRNVGLGPGKGCTRVLESSSRDFVPISSARESE